MPRARSTTACPCSSSAMSWDEYLAPVKLDDSGKEEMVALLTAESEKVASTISNYEVDRRVNNSRTVDPTDATLIEPLDAA